MQNTVTKSTVPSEVHRELGQAPARAFWTDSLRGLELAFRSSRQVLLRSVGLPTVTQDGSWDPVVKARALETGELEVQSAAHELGPGENQAEPCATKEAAKLAEQWTTISR